VAQRDAAWCPRGVAGCCCKLQCVAGSGGLLQGLTASKLISVSFQCIAVCCSVLQCVAG